MSLIWLSNGADYRIKENAAHFQAEAWAEFVEWARDKKIGRPRATEHYTVEELEEMGVVGYYG